MTAARWLPVVRWEGVYEVSDAGAIRRVGSDQPRAAHPNHRGYLGVILSQGPRRAQVTNHRAVLEAFVGPCPEGMQACHNNGDCADNRLANLRWDTPQGNAQDRIAHGTQYRPSDEPTCGRGHDMTDESNVYVRQRNGYAMRSCRACAKVRDKRYRTRLAMSAVVGAAALAVSSTPASASKPHSQDAVCHPKAGGWVVISPDHASSHFDEATGAPKHEHDSRVDQYAVSVAGVWTCPAIPTPTTPEPSPTSHPTHTETPCPSTSTTSTTSPPSSTSTSATSGPSPSSNSSTPTTTRPSTEPTPSAQTKTPSSRRTVSPTLLPSIAASTLPSEPSSTPASLARTGPVGSAALVGLGLLALLLGAFAYAYAVGSRRGEGREH